jgi:hypothetical protein
VTLGKLVVLDFKRCWRSTEELWPTRTSSTIAAPSIIITIIILSSTPWPIDLWEQPP